MKKKTMTELRRAARLVYKSAEAARIAANTADNDRIRLVRAIEEVNREATTDQFKAYLKSVGEVTQNHSYAAYHETYELQKQMGELVQVLG